MMMMMVVVMMMVMLSLIAAQRLGLRRLYANTSEFIAKRKTGRYRTGQPNLSFGPPRNLGLPEV